MATGLHRRAFISYSRVNKDFATKLTKSLRTAGYPVWFDQLDIPTGARWDDEVEKALRECSIFMIILTPASIISENVKDEIGYAIDHGKRILPVLLEDCDVPLMLRRFQYVDFTTKSFEEGFESAKELLGDLIDQVSTPVPVQTPVVEPKPAPVKAAPAPAMQEKKAEPMPAQVAAGKSGSKGLYFGIGAVLVVIILGVIGLSMFGKGGNAPVPTATNPPTLAPTTLAPTTAVENTPTTMPSSVPTTPAINVESLIPKAHILVYEDTGGDVGLLVEPMLKKVGYGDNAQFVDDRVGDFKTALTTPNKKWDLVIVAAESHGGVSGELWSYVKDQLDIGTAVIIETWQVDIQGEGQIKSILQGCGTRLQKNLDLAVPIKWYVSDNPLFNTPNQVPELSILNRHWQSEAGDLMQLTPGSKATILAGTSSSLADAGVIVSCYDGRMILQTFSNHDYPIAQVSALWQNYVYNTLKNHFLKITQ